jgi:hypothetical protein
MIFGRAVVVVVVVVAVVVVVVLSGVEVVPSTVETQWVYHGRVVLMEVFL